VLSHTPASRTTTFDQLTYHVQPAEPQRSTGCTTHVQQVERLKPNIEKKPLNEEYISPNQRLTPTQLALVEVGWFDHFWRGYWRKTAKIAASKAFHAKVKTLADWERVQAALARQMPEMLAREIQYRPHAATWLNQGSWRDADEVSPPQQTNGPGSALDRNQQRREEGYRIAEWLRRTSAGGERTP
jgi:hypothetical protein